MKKFNLHNQEYFPTFSNLPEDHVHDTRYYEKPDEDGGFGPVKHWCFLGEIVQLVPYWRPMFKGKDKIGKEFLVACYFDTHGASPQWMKHVKTGNTISIMYADRHVFMDGQIGIRLEDVDRVNVYPCRLSTFLEIPGRLSSLLSSKTCQECKEEANQQCACKVRYCDRDCQKVHWEKAHKTECQAILDISDWKRREWTMFDDAYWC